ncbi:hypothetical protein [Desulfitobacterium sp.]|uniref:hypothetical protein n=1 Tax=Desulfitobacterium sp. TaxID=49981 RepID=UPI002BC6906E|nr:hypothetical protein [Desulfitobacterium sp.]HVJ48128.1 hypothetical protein [Desulfitobacterium sp.]
MLKEDIDLSLVYKERVGDILFLLGTILAIISTYQAEQSIVTKLLRIKSTQDNSANTTALASWLFFTASIIFANVAIIRLVELKQPTNSKVSPSILRGSKFTVIGNIFKVVGFGLAAIGNQLKANSLNDTFTKRALRLHNR